ncbi:MAG: serine hydrolase [Saonia sp.]
MKKIVLFIILLGALTISYGQKTKSKEIDELIRSYEKDGYFHGSVLVYEKGKVLLKKSYGIQHPQIETKNTNSSIYRIYSTTKTFTASVILLLEEQGKLSLSDKLSTYFSDFPKGDEITIENLLTHTSGIPDDTNPEHTKNEKSFLGFIYEQPLDFVPNTNWRYSNSGYYLLGYIIQKITGIPYEQAVTDYILKPLHMQRSGFAFKSLRDSDKTTGFEYLTRNKFKKAIVFDEPHPFAAGAMYSTTGDLLKYYKGLKEFRVLEEETLLKAQTPYNGSNYGYGWEKYPFVQKKATGHNGGGPGFQSRFLTIFDKDICIIVLSNAETNIDLSTKLATILLSSKTVEHPKPEKIAHKKLELLKGAYNSPDSKFLIYLDDGILSFNESKYTSSKNFLIPENEKRFYINAIFNGVEGKVYFDFKSSENGDIESLEVRFPDGMVKTAPKTSSAIPWGIIGSATSNGWEGDDIPLTPDNQNPDILTINNITLNEGEFKFRANNDWNINLGIDDEGYLGIHRKGIKVKKGVYDIVLNVTDPINPVFSITKSQ